MHIVYTLDNRFAEPTGISILSLLDSNKTALELNLHIVGNALSEINKDKLKRCAEMYTRNIAFYEAPDVEGILEQRIYSGSYWSIANYSRLFLTEILPASLRRVIYLDGDTLITGSLQELWKMKFDRNCVIGAVQERVGSFRPDKHMFKYLGLEDADIYINSGVMLMNLEVIRDTKVVDKYIAYMESCGYVHLYNDQDVFNGALKGMIQRIDPKYNIIPNLYTEGGRELIYRKAKYDTKYFERMLQAADEPCVIHFTTTHCCSYRPWYKGCLHPYTAKWRDFKKISPWHEEPLKPMSVGFEKYARWVLKKMPVRAYIIYFHLKNSKLFFSLKIFRIRRKVKKTQKSI